MNDMATALTKVLADLSDGARSEFNHEYWKKQDVGIEHVGTKITLPAEPREMDYDDAIDALARKRDADNQRVDVVEQIVAGYPLDAAVALVKAMQRKYGWASPVPTPGFFGPSNPDMMTVQTSWDPKQAIQVPLGSFKVPGIENDIHAHIGRHSGSRLHLCIHASVSNKERHVIMELIALAKEILKEESIYKGKALRIHVDDKGNIKEGMEPEFMFTGGTFRDELVLSKDTENILNTALFTPIEKTEACVKAGIPLRRGVLLEGPYGTGKSMSAAVTARVCEDNGWTFIALDNVKGLRAALEFAQRYQPAVVFAEDIDRLMDERDEDANDLLNTIDGVLSKSSKVITVLTTNFIEKIDQAMLRPGRLDAVISIDAPDAEASQRLVRLYARGKLPVKENLSALGLELAGQIPATIREVVERSKLAMIMRGGDHLTQEDLLIVAKGMKRHLELLNRDRTVQHTAEERLGIALGEIVKSQHSIVRDEVETLIDDVDTIRSAVA